MIVNIRGGSGSGKSTVVRKIMDCYDTRTPHFIEGRKQPLWYDLKDSQNPQGRTLRVLGHYEVACGGCDTISGNGDEPAMKFIHRLIREAYQANLHVLYEGVILTTIAGDLIPMIQEKLPIVVVNLTSDLETCLRGITARRLAKKGITDPTPEQIAEMKASLGEVTIKNNIGKLRSAMKTARQLREAGASVFDCDREAAVTFIRETFDL